MSRKDRITAPGVEASAVVRAPERAGATASAWEAEPLSGVVLRGEVLTSVPRLAVSMPELIAMPLDHRAGFIASFVDGTFTIEMILDACALPREEALAILADLVARGAVVI